MAAENTAFSTSGEDAITRTIDVQADDAAKGLSSEDFDEFYDIARTAEEIVAGGYKKIALQFPDSLLHDSVPIYRRLRSRIGSDQELYVLADTSCCVDEVAAQHADADALVHYGYACMTLSSRLPVFYVFGRKEIDLDDCVSKFLKIINGQMSGGTTEPKAIALRHDVVYTHKMDEISTKLRKSLDSERILLRYNPIQKTSRPPSETLEYLPSTSDGSEDVLSDILYIGEESLGLTNILMTHGSSQVHSYNPKTRSTRLESSSTNKMLMKRYAAVQKARNSDVFGILVGTLGVASYLPLIKHLRALLNRNRKKSYTISVGKLNPAKLANFLEIECFILVACPENSLIDSKEFLRPIVTPFELEIALQAEMSWTGRYVLSFEQLLREHAQNASSSSVNGHDGDEQSDDPDRPEFSLLTGTYRHAKRYGGEGKTQQGDSPSTSSSVVVRNKEQGVAVLENSAAGQFLQSRTYQGLDPRLGEDEPGELEQGRSGIAKGYGENIQL